MVNELMKVEQALEMLDDAVAKYSQTALAAKQTFKQCLVISMAAQQIEAALTDEVMRLAFMPLKDKEWGFRTDEAARVKKGQPPYSMQDVRECMVMAVLADAIPARNELNILARRTYLTLNYFRRKLKEYPGLTDLSLHPGKIQWVPSGALVDFSATWRLSGKDMRIEKTGAEAIPVRVNEGMGADAVLGKATRKTLKAIYDLLTGSDHPDGDVGDIDAGDLKPVEGVSVDAPPQTNKRTEQAKELLRQAAQKRREEESVPAPATEVPMPAAQAEPPKPPPVAPKPPTVAPKPPTVAPKPPTVAPKPAPPQPPAKQPDDDGVPPEEEMDTGAPWVTGEEGAAEPEPPRKASVTIAKTGRRKNDAELFVIADSENNEYLTRDTKMAYQAKASVGKSAIMEWTESDNVRTIVSITPAEPTAAPIAQPAPVPRKTAPKKQDAAPNPAPTQSATTPAPAQPPTATPAPAQKKKIEEATCRIGHIAKVPRGDKMLFRLKDERNTAYFTEDENVAAKLVQFRDSGASVLVSYYEEGDENIITDLQPVEAAAAEKTAQQPPEASL